MAPRRPKMAPRRLQDGPRRLQEGLREAHEGPRGAQEGSKRGPRGPQEGPQEGSKRELGTNLAQRPLRDPPRTLPDPSGERFRDKFGPTKRTQTCTQMGPKRKESESSIVHCSS